MCKDVVRKLGHALCQTATSLDEQDYLNFMAIQRLAEKPYANMYHFYALNLL